AFWRGVETNRMLSRIYGISFPSREELDEYLKKLDEARKRDHRRLGVELELFNIYEAAGAGLVFWHPKGMRLKRIIEDYWYKMHEAEGYLFVNTPHIARGQLWHISGHYDYYFENMYTMNIEKEEFVLKPMNCPGHILIYQSRIRSYRDLPLRLAELGTVYRRERSGVLQGLLRVRGFTIDDAHIFCTPEQINDELVKVISLAQRILKKFGFEQYQVELSVWDPREKSKFLGSESEWLQAEEGLISALSKLSLPYKRMEGEAAFYGPKVDIKILDALGRPWQATTVQFDFNAPRRFNIRYMDRDGGHRQVVIIHRAILGSIERFIGTLIEHYGGAFPLWLAPVQVVILTITEKEIPYAEKIYNELNSAGLRVEINFKNEKINYKIREAEVQKIPYMIIIGEREVASGDLAIRRQKKGDLGRYKLSDFLNMIRTEISL
ncbi:MAG: threonine--tRNA ligase, partial [candidate division WOR-3 bacterium]